MTNISLSTIVTELSRDGSRCAYLLLSDTEEKAAQMYGLVKNEIVARGIPHRIIDFKAGNNSLSRLETYVPFMAAANAFEPNLSPSFVSRPATLKVGNIMV